MEEALGGKLSPNSSWVPGYIRNVVVGNIEVLLKVAVYFDFDGTAVVADE